jgi:hypothetical protein
MTAHDDADRRFSTLQEERDMPATHAQNAWPATQRQIAHLPSMSVPRTRQYGIAYASQVVDFEIDNAIGTLLTIVVREVPDAIARKTLLEQLEEIRFAVQEAVR